MLVQGLGGLPAGTADSISALQEQFELQYRLSREPWLS